jgi:bifunctional non-homologous end joining protein LigD
MANRFVIQEHTTPEGVHWDLMIEKGGVLATFRLSQSPEHARDHAIEAVRIFDHPLRFLTYEGPVQKGTGKVRIVEAGTCRLLDESEDRIALDLQGTLLQGSFTLMRLGGATWEFTPQPQHPA